MDSVRLAYLDEAGIGKREQEPLLVVAGVIIDGDGHWQAIERHLKSMVRRHVPEQERAGFVFHAKDVHHGAGHFDRCRWSRGRRIALMEELAGIPARFHVPVVVGVSDRGHITAEMRKRSPGATERQATAWSYTEAYLQCVRDIDRWMDRETRGTEVVMIVAEDTPEVKAGIKPLHLGMRRDDDSYWTEQGFDVFSTRHVVDTVHFAEKPDCALLQVADVCAFVLKRALMGKADAGRLFDLLSPQLVVRPRDGMWTFPDGPLPREVRFTMKRSDVEAIG